MIVVVVVAAVAGVTVVVVEIFLFSEGKLLHSGLIISVLYHKVSEENFIICFSLFVCVCFIVLFIVLCN